MISKTLTVLAAATLVSQALAISPRHHAHQAIHQRKRALQTEFTTIVEYVTTTVYEDDDAAPTSTAAVSTDHAQHFSPASSATTSSVVVRPTTSTSTPVVPSTSSTRVVVPTTSSAPVVVPTTSSTPVVVPTTFATLVNSPAVSTAVNVVSTPVAQSTQAVSTQAPEPVSGGLKRGLAYNDPNLLGGFVASGSKVSWAYNWGQSNDMKVDVEFVPMLWGPGDNHVTSWTSNANKAIAAGSKALLSFNEPDNAGQSNLSPDVAKAGHIQYMNPFQGKALIGAPAITNSGAATQGIGWLQSFMSSCAGNCVVDFLPIHWYAPANAVSYFFSHLLKVHAAFPDKPVWITEFAPSGTDDEINAFVTKVVDQLDNNATFSFVARYSYFMVTPGRLISSGTTLSTYGKTYAFA